MLREVLQQSFTWDLFGQSNIYYKNTGNLRLNKFCVK